MNIRYPIYEGVYRILTREIPQLQEIAGKTWKKEDELKQLKSELAALDRKIQLELAPVHTEMPGQGQEQGGGQAVTKADIVRSQIFPLRTISVTMLS